LHLRHLILACFLRFIGIVYWNAGNEKFAAFMRSGFLATEEGGEHQTRSSGASGNGIIQKFSNCPSMVSHSRRLRRCLAMR